MRPPSGVYLMALVSRWKKTFLQRPWVGFDWGQVLELPGLDHQVAVFYRGFQAEDHLVHQ